MQLEKGGGGAVASRVMSSKLRTGTDTIDPTPNMLADGGYDADWYRDVLDARGFNLASHLVETERSRCHGAKFTTKDPTK